MAKTKAKILQMDIDGEMRDVTPLDLLLYTTGELGDVAGVDPSRIRQLAAEGRFAGARKIGRDWMIPSEAAERWLKQDRDRRLKSARDAGSTDD